MALLAIGALRQPIISPRKTLPHKLVRSQGSVLLCLEVSPEEAETDAGITKWAQNQNHILCSYLPKNDVLPLKLGAVFSSVTAAEKYLRQTWPSLEDQISKIAANVEYSVTVHSAHTAPETNDILSDGASYLRDRKNLRRGRLVLSRNRAEFLRRMGTKIEANSLATCTLRNSGKNSLFAMATLVPRQKADEFVADLLPFSNETERLNLSCQIIGPSPTYSFVNKTPMLEERTIAQPN